MARFLEEARRGRFGEDVDARSEAFGARPKLHIMPPRYVKPQAKAAASEGQVGESADSRTTESARGVTAGAGAALAGVAGPCPGASAASGGTDAADAAWGGRS